MASIVEIYHNYTSHRGSCIKDLLKIGRPPAYKTKTEQCNLEEGEFLYQKIPKILRAPGEDRNNMTLRVSALTTEQVEALWPARLKII